MVHRSTHALVCLTFLVVGVLLITPAHAAERKNAREHPVNTKLRKIISQIDAKVFGGKRSEDVKNLKTLIKSAPTDELKLKASAFLGRYYLQLEHNPAKAIEAVLPFVVSRDIAKAWVKANKDGYKTAMETYKVKLKEAKKAKLDKKPYPEKPSKADVYAALPKSKEMTVNQKTARAAIVIGYACMQMKKYPAAMEILRRSGAGTTDLVRILANEGAGDLFLVMRKLDKAVDFYKFAMKYVRQTQKNLDDYGVKREVEVTWHGEDDYYKNRIQKKLSVAIAMLESEKFGADFVLYKRAQQYRLIEKDYASAFYAYRDLIEQFPGTIWSEAAEAYRIKTLLILSTMKPTRKTKLSARAEELKIEIRGLTIQLKIMEMKKIAKVIITEMKEYIAGYKKELAQLKKIPYGAKAQAVAEKLAKKFLTENELGLYRGEVLTDFAN